MYQEKNEAIRIAPKLNSSLETSPHVIQKRHAMHQSLTLNCKYPAETLLDHCKLVPEEVKKTTESTKQ